MVYRLLGWGVVGRAYHKVCHVLVQKFYLIMELVDRLKMSQNFLKQGLEQF